MECEITKDVSHTFGDAFTIPFSEVLAFVESLVSFLLLLFFRNCWKFSFSSPKYFPMLVFFNCFDFVFAWVRCSCGEILTYSMLFLVVFFRIKYNKIPFQQDYDSWGNPSTNDLTNQKLSATRKKYELLFNFTKTEITPAKFKLWFK